MYFLSLSERAFNHSNLELPLNPEYLLSQHARPALCIPSTADRRSRHIQRVALDKERLAVLLPLVDLSERGLVEVDAVYNVAVADLLEAFAQGVGVGPQKHEEFRVVEDEVLDQHGLTAHRWTANHQRIERLVFFTCF